MAVGEYISVSSQRDTEQADVDKERAEQETETGRERELDELTQIYIERGLDFHLARQVGFWQAQSLPYLCLCFSCLFGLDCVNAADSHQVLESHKSPAL